MDYTELKDKPREELLRLLDETREKVRVLRMKAGEGQLKSAHQLGELKKTIARILTRLRDVA